MSSIDEKRVYTEEAGTTVLFVATESGLARVEASGDQVGRFGLVHRGEARDVAAIDGPDATAPSLVVATAEDVLVGPPGDLAPTGFGPATAAGAADGAVAAGGGRVARLDARPDGATADGGAWTDLGSVPAVRAVDGDLVAAAGGVFRLDGSHVGLDDAHDVSVAGGPLAATAAGLYRLGNGWLTERDGEFRVASADGTGGRAHAATPDALLARRGREWREADLPVGEPVVDVGYAEGAVYAVTEACTVLAAAGDGWRSRSLGLPGACGLAVARADDAAGER